METEKTYFCPMDKKWFPLHLNGVLGNILICVQFSSKLAKLPNVYGLSCSYLDVGDTLVSFLLLMPDVCSGGFKDTLSTIPVVKFIIIISESVFESRDNVNTFVPSSFERFCPREFQPGNTVVCWSKSQPHTSLPFAKLWDNWARWTLLFDLLSVVLNSTWCHRNWWFPFQCWWRTVASPVTDKQ